MNKKLALELAEITEKAAIASAKWIGKGDRHKADEAATEAMRMQCNKTDFNATIVIGEGERDEAPMLFIGEKVGTGKGMKIDLAVDPLECTNAVADGKPNSITVMAAAPAGTLLNAPDTYMDKIAVGSEAAGKIDLDWPVEKNIKAVAKALGKKVEDVTVVVLKRERHEKLIQEIRKTKARIHLIDDGDIAGAIATAMPESEIDMLLGTGAAPEGVIAAAALSCLGGELQGRLKLRNEEEKIRAKKMGITDFNKKLLMKDLVNTDNAMFVATGVTTGFFLKGIEFKEEKVITNSVIMEAKTGTVRRIETKHLLKEKQ